MDLPDFSSMEEKKKYVECLWQEVKDQLPVHFRGTCYEQEDICRLEWAGDVPVIRFSVFDEIPFVNAAFSTRFGGVSEGNLGELNLGFSRGDTQETVAENFRIFCSAVGVLPENLVLSDQIHETVVKCVTKEDACGETIKKKLQEIDGLCTQEAGLCLATSFADCVPLFFADPMHHAIAASHSGWRGTVGKIGAKTVQEMGRAFGSRPEEIIAVIGPSICRDCYEVDGEVVSAFEKEYLPEHRKQIVYPGKCRGKYQLDLWAANVLALKEAGMVPEHIHVSGICTCCHPQLFYSHRASRGKRGNLNGFMAIRE